MQPQDGGSQGEAGVAGVVIAVGDPSLVPTKASPPRFRVEPDCVSSRGDEAIELARTAGLELDQSQQDVLRGALGLRADGTWAANEVAVVEPRQNGKGAILEARELAGLFLFGEELITHSAHLVDTSLEHFRRLLALIEDTPELDRRVKKVRNANGQESIELMSGERIRFRTRSKGGGRGFSSETLILDEAMFLPEFNFGALKPSQSAKHNPQVWFTGSAVDQEAHEHGIVFARVRERALSGESKRLAYFEWGAHVDLLPAEADDDVLSDPQVWADANPAHPERISFEAIESEFESMSRRTFAVERCGIGDWPRTDGQEETVIAFQEWLALADGQSRMVDPVCLAFDVLPDRRSSIAAAGWRDDGLLHVEVIEAAAGTSWVVDRLAGLCARHEVASVVCDGFGPAASLLAACKEADVVVRGTSAGEMAQACGLLADRVAEKKVRHRGSDELASALRGARTRPMSDRWIWARRPSSTDISPLVAATLALWAADQLDTGGGVEIF